MICSMLYYVAMEQVITICHKSLTGTVEGDFEP